MHEMKKKSLSQKLILKAQLVILYRKVKNRVALFFSEKESETREPKIAAIYFTYGPHFDMVYMSICSLLDLNSDCLASITIYFDEKKPFDDSQIKRLKELDDRVILKNSLFGCHWLGQKQLLSELVAYHEVAMSLKEGDCIMKVDSDIVFINDSIFTYVQKKKKDVVATLVGIPGVVNPPTKYLQGGCYFMARHVVADCSFMGLLQAISKSHRLLPLKHPQCLNMPDIPVDMWMNTFLECRGFTVDLNRHYYFPLNDWFDNKVTFKDEYSVLHMESYIVKKLGFLKEVNDAGKVELMREAMDRLEANNKRRY